MAQYDQFAEQYNDMVVSGRSESSYRYILEQVRNFTSEQGYIVKICDVGCGQGELSSRLASLGAEVTGVDLSRNLLDMASKRTDNVKWILDDAAVLSKIPDSEYDFVISSVMLVDVPSHEEVFKASCRILKPGGIMIWVITHPCFQSPYSYPLGDGSRRISDYARQFWKSDGQGTIRSTLGAYHRPLADYLNDFIAAGFTPLRVDELERSDTSVDSLPLLFAAVGRKTTEQSG